MNRRRWPVIAGLFVIAVVACAVLWFTVFRDRPGPPPIPNNDPGTGNPPSVPTLDKATIEAWQARGFEAGWMGKREGQWLFEPRRELVSSPVPAFRPERGRVFLGLKDLPPVTVPFALSLTGDGSLTSGAMKGLGEYKSLTVLFVGSTGVTDAALEEVAGLKNLTTLGLIVTAVSDAGLKHLAGLTNLTELFLGSTPVTDAGLKHLAGLANLASLDLYGTKVTGTGFTHLAGLAKLTSLNLSRTPVTDKELKHVAELKNLVYLDLRFTKVTDAGVKELKMALPKCAIVK
jgi:Leucine-rich repeat (LRR) protein